MSDVNGSEGALSNPEGIRSACPSLVVAGSLLPRRAGVCTLESDPGWSSVSMLSLSSVAAVAASVAAAMSVRTR
jgi:hypothetical protein